MGPALLPTFALAFLSYRKQIAACPKAVPIGQLAEVKRSPGRYKTLYVEDESFGLKLLSGRQMAQYKPIAMKIMSRGAWDKPEDYLLSPGMVLLTADGRFAC